jgi:hypothetical protein
VQIIWYFCGVSFGTFVAFHLVFLWRFIWYFCGISFGIFAIFHLLIHLPLLPLSLIFRELYRAFASTRGGCGSTLGERLCADG